MRTHRALLVLWSIAAAALTTAITAADLAPNVRRLRWANYAKQPADWFRGPEARTVADNILSHRSTNGIWPKSVDTFGTRFAGDPESVKGTFDNGATVGECRFLARICRAGDDPRYRAALDQAIRLVLKAQYPSGGWPQSFPPGRGYARHITFNDGTMVNLMTLMRDVAERPDFESVPPSLRAEARRAFDRGIQCILRCQVRQRGTLTAWCAQHDAVTLEPRPARTYEPPSLSGAESAQIVRLLMSLPAPSPEVVRAVNTACAWFETARLVGIREVRRNGDKGIVPDPSAPPLWARFYELGSNRPIFIGRDGVQRYELAQIEAERRNGYAWYGDWGAQLLAEWPAWKRMKP